MVEESMERANIISEMQIEEQKIEWGGGLIFNF